MAYSYNDLFNTHMYPEHNMYTGRVIKTPSSPLSCMASCGNKLCKELQSFSSDSKSNDTMTVIENICSTTNKIKTLTEKLNLIITEPSYTFFEEDFNTVSKKWKELTESRTKLLGELTSNAEIPDINQYMSDLSVLSTLNKERNEMYTELQDVIQKPFLCKEQSYKEENEKLRVENKKLEETLTEMSKHATRYSTAKEREIDELRVQLEQVKNNTNNFKNDDNICTRLDNCECTNLFNDAQLLELKKRIEALVQSSFH